MKKFIAIFAAIFISCMIICPCFTFAAVPLEDNSAGNTCYDLVDWQTWRESHLSDYPHYLYVRLHVLRRGTAENSTSYGDMNYYVSVLYGVNENQVTFDSSNNIVTFTRGNSLQYQGSMGYPYSNTPTQSIKNWLIEGWTNNTINLDLNNNTVSGFANASGDYVTTLRLIDCYTDLFSFTPHVDLSFNFTPNMQGSVSRSMAVNGVMYDSQGLNISVTNNNANAQFALFIVNHGDNISFTSQIDGNYGYTNQGFVGSPVYAFVTDEWVTYNRGFAASPIYTDSYFQPSIWHYIASGDNYYNVAPWSNMNLNRNTQYDLVAYGCLNDTTNNCSCLSYGDIVEELYRTSFTIMDPAIYNPSDTSISGVYPWNNNDQTNDIFNHSSAYKDSTGNITIRSEYGENNLYGNGVSSVSTLNTSFKDYFNFINGGLNCFPKQFLTILSAGLTGVVVIGFCKVVLHA